jgi:hypothetical protein
MPIEIGVHGTPTWREEATTFSAFLERYIAPSLRADSSRESSHLMQKWLGSRGQTSSAVDGPQPEGWSIQQEAKESQKITPAIETHQSEGWSIQRDANNLQNTPATSGDSQLEGLSFQQEESTPRRAPAAVSRARCGDQQSMSVNEDTCGAEQREDETSHTAAGSEAACGDQQSMSLKRRELAGVHEPQTKHSCAVKNAQESSESGEGGVVGEAIAYLAQHSIFEHLPELQEDIREPKLWQEGYEVRNIWMGTRATVTPLHYDSMDNLFCQVAGACCVK